MGSKGFFGRKVGSAVQTPAENAGSAGLAARGLREEARSHPRGRDEVSRDPVHRFGDRTRDCREGVGVPAERDRVADRVLEARRFERARDRLRNRALAGLVEGVTGADLIDCTREVVPVCVLDGPADLSGRDSLERELDCVGGRPGALHSLGVVVRDRGDSIGGLESILDHAVAVKKRCR